MVRTTAADIFLANGDEVNLNLPNFFHPLNFFLISLFGATIY